MTILKILLIILIGLLFFFIYLMDRNNRVHKERKRMIDWIYEQPEWKEKRKLLISPSYDEMFYKFWKPVKSFYKKYLNN